MEFDVTAVHVVEDGRGGELYEPVAGEDLLAGRVRNIHVVTMNPGDARGNHYHPEQTESLCIGPGVVLYTLEDGERVEYVVCSSNVRHHPQKPDRVKKVVVPG